MSFSDFASVLGDVPTLLTLKKGMKPRPLDEVDCFGRHVSATAEKYGNEVAVIFGDRSQTWRELNDESCRFAGALANLGVERGDVVSLMMENRPEFISLCIAINKLGAVAALINNNLREKPLQHCITTSDSKLCVFGTELNDAIEGIRASVSLSEDGFVAVRDSESSVIPDWASDLSALSSNLEPTEPPAQDASDASREFVLHIYFGYNRTTKGSGHVKSPFPANGESLPYCWSAMQATRSSLSVPTAVPRYWANHRSWGLHAKWSFHCPAKAILLK